MGDPGPLGSVGGPLSLGLGDDTDQTTVVALVVANVTINCGKDRPIATYAYAITGVETGAQLANDDVARFHELSITTLHAPILGV